MRIGFDLDGVLANFEHRMAALIVKTTGRDLFPPDYFGPLGPPTWDWWKPVGYTREEINQVWEQGIKASPNFWLSLEPHWDNINTLALCIEDLEQSHDVYFITNRPGYRVKRQTESWLKMYLPYVDEAVHPTVLLSSNKGHAASTLRLDAYIDDNLDNVKAVLRESPKTRTYLLNRNYNRGEASVDIYHEGHYGTNQELTTLYATRVNTLGEMLTAELVAQ